MPVSSPDSFVAPLNALQALLAPTLVAGGAPVETILPQALDLALRCGGATYGRLALLSADGASLIWPEAHGSDETVAGSLAEIDLRALETAVRRSGEPAAAILDGTHAFAAPLGGATAVAGSLTALRGAGGPFTPREQEGLLFCAALIAQALLAARAQAAQADLRSELAAMLVHDLQGPLGNIVASLEMAREARPDGDGVAEDMLEVALHSSYQLRTLVASVLDISRLEAGQPLPARAAIDAQQLLEDAVAIVRPELDLRGITVVVDAAPDAPPALGNAGMIRRVLLNLLDNALKASRRGQTVWIRVGQESTQSELTFAVIDQGGGIPSADRERIFEKFQRLNSGGESQGLGLGLAFCRLAIDAHDGRIWVEETPGGGATFYFTLPLAGSAPAPQA